MDFEFSDEQVMFRNMAREFVQRHVEPIAKEIDREQRFPRELLKELGPLGLLGMLVPQEYGGLQTDTLCYTLVIEELAKSATSVATLVIGANVLFNWPLVEWGNEQQRRKYLAPSARGEIIGCLALTEPNAGSDAFGLETSAVLKGDTWVLNGNKIFISHGGVADAALVFAQTDRKLRHRGMIAILVDRGTPGFSSKDIHGKIGPRAGNLAELVFQDCRVPAANLVGRVGDGYKVAMSGIDRGRVSVGAMAVGVGEACIDACVSHAQQRQQFGRPIGSFQLVQELIAEMIVEVEAAKYLTYHLAYLIDKGKATLKDISVVKYYCSEVAQRVTYKAIQVHGGYGIIDDYNMERFYRDVRWLTIADGTSEIHKLTIAGEALGIRALT